MALNLTAASTTVYQGVRTTLPGVVNSQVIPVQKVRHFSPCNLGTTAAGISSYQLMGGALVTSPPPTSATAGIFPIVYTAPTAAQLLAAYAGSKQRVNAGDVFSVLVFNTGGTGLSINASGVTGVTGGFSMSSGTNVNGLAGTEANLHINWLQVSADGTTGAYQLF